MKILIIEDEPALASSIAEYLEQDGFLCEVAGTYAEAMLKSDVYEYDCILVDISLPGGSGLDVIRSLKVRQSNVGIIIISAKYSLDQKIKGLEIGSDDYLTKPFHLSELNARVKALLRRKQFSGQQSIDFQEITLLTTQQVVTVNGIPLNLTLSEYRLLLYFLANQHRVLSKESIAEHLAGDQADMLDSLDFIYSHIKNLRKKMVNAGAQDYIHAVYGMGYKFSER